MQGLMQSAPAAIKGAGSDLLRATKLSFKVSERYLLRDISLTVRAGEVVGLVGPNGAGKSTLMRVLSGVWKASAGHALLCGQPINSYTSRQIARLVGQVQQLATLDAPFSVQDIVAMGRNPHVGRFEVQKPHDHQAVLDAMRATNILKFAERVINTLSAGERQRVFLARALAQEPSLLLLDEPTSSLDIRHQLEILTLVQDQAHRAGLGVLIAIHDLALAARFCDRLILLHGGQLMAEGSPDAVLTQEYLAQAFEVQAQPYSDPFTHELKLSITMPEAPNKA
jgi:iron complex transport system ATP-binding protein